MFNFDRLIEDRDVAGLVAALRQKDDPDLREAAARCLGDLGEMQAAEGLIRACKEDPDSGVKKAAYAALQLLAGASTELAISSYDIPPDDPWLVENNPDDDEYEEGVKMVDDLMEETEEQELEGESNEEQEARFEALQGFVEKQDLPSLVLCLRDREDADLRGAAAQALGEMGNPEAVEALICAHLLDPDPEVRQAAFEAVDILSVGNAGVAISLFGPLPEGEWLAENRVRAEILEPFDDDTPPYETDLEEFVEEKDLEGLVVCLRDVDDTDLRLAAVGALLKLGVPEAAEPLARAHLEDPDEQVRQAAFEALETLNPGQASQLVAAQRALTPQAGTWLVEPDPNLVEIIPEAAAEAEPETRPDQVQPADPAQPAEDRFAANSPEPEKSFPGMGIIILAAFALIVIAAIILLLVARLASL